MSRNDNADAREQPPGRRRPAQQQPPRDQFQQQQQQYSQQAARQPQVAPRRQAATQPQQGQQHAGPTGQRPSQNPQGARQTPGGAMGGQAAVQPTGAGTATRSQQAPGTATGRQAGARPRLPTATIEDVLQTDTVTAAPETPIRTVVAQMAKEGVGSVVVTDGATPVGILTDREIALALEGIPNVADRQAGELLGETLVTGSTEMTVFQALDRLREEGIRRLPIVDEDGSLRGIVTLDDILVLLGTELANATELIRGQSPRL